MTRHGWTRVGTLTAGVAAAEGALVHLGRTAGGWFGIVPADFVMSRDHLHGVKERAERLAPSGADAA